MAINKNHPDYPEYIEKCKALRDEMSVEVDAVPCKPRCGFDDSPTIDIHRKYSKKLKELQAEYSYLFE